MNQSEFITSALDTIDAEKTAIEDLSQRIGPNFAQACDLLLNCSGRAVVTGIGKSGHIANKVAATLASTGTPALFVHPGEASHGDLGMITASDVVIAISNSGATAEIVTLLPILNRLSVPLISLTGNENSLLAKAAVVNLDVSVSQEACPLDLAPTSSTTAALVMGDALAVALLKARGFTAEDFAMSHPGGTLGKRLILQVADVMRSGQAVPAVTIDTLVPQALEEITQKGLGMTLVLDAKQKLVGIFTDGDLRRAIDVSSDIASLSMSQVMSQNPRTIEQNELAIKALQTMESAKITTLVVTHENNYVGVLHMHDLLHTGLA